MKRWIGPGALAIVVAFALVLGSTRGGPTSDGERVERLTEQLRCPVCDGLAVADSPSSTARAIAADVRSRVSTGETDDDIRNAYVAQYGDWILLEPPAGGFGVLVWALPVALALAGAAGATWTIRRRSAARSGGPSSSARALVADALANGANR